MNNFDCLFISRFPPPYGGVSTQARLIAENYSHKRSLSVCTIDLLSFNYHIFNGENWISKSFISFKFFSPFFIYSTLFYFFRLLKALRPVGLFNFDKFIVWRLLLLLLASYLNTLFDLRNLRVIYSFHVGAPSTVGGALSLLNHSKHLKATFGEFFTNFSKLSVQKTFINAIAGITNYFPCSRYCQKFLHSFNPEATSRVIYYGSPLESLYEASRLRPPLFSQDCIEVTFLGRHVEEMGIFYFLDFTQSLLKASGHHFVFNICGQRSSLTNYLKTSCKHVNVFSNVSEDKKQSILINSDLLLVPSLNERACFGLAIVEGISAGCFVLARNIGGHSEACLDFTDYLFEPHLSSSELASKFLSCLSNYCSPKHILKRQSLQNRIVNSYDVKKSLETQLTLIDEHF